MRLALQWVNPVRENAYFQDYTWQHALSIWKPNWGTKPPAFVPQPTADMATPHDWDPPEWWIYQNTHVDLSSIAPVVQQAMQVVGAQRKGTTLS